jgi:hypothetical protein
MEMCDVLYMYVNKWKPVYSFLHKTIEMFKFLILIYLINSVNAKFDDLIKKLIK